MICGWPLALQADVLDVAPGSRSGQGQAKVKGGEFGALHEKCDMD